MKETLKSILEESSDGNVFLNETKEKSVLKAVEIHTQEVVDRIKKIFEIDVKLEHWGFRNERGRRVEEDGHTHEESDALFSAICCIEGRGPWVLLDDSTKCLTKSGQTVVLVERRAVSSYPDKLLKACHHGSPEVTGERIIFLASYK